MLWHSGDLVDAVKKVKELEKNLFVFVRDENTKKEYIDILETSEELHEILKNSICLNLLKDTVEYQQFNDVYGVTNVPSIFIISHEGKVIETITTLSDELRLCNILRRIYGLQMKENFFYFAFGSNLLKERILLNNPTAKFISIGTLQNYKLGFLNSCVNYIPKFGWKGGTASIIPLAASFVCGAIWEINIENLSSLDAQEGVPLIYFPVKVKVEKPNGEYVTCRTYRMHDFEVLRPSPYYLDIIIRGACQSGLPNDYIEQLLSIEHNGYLGPCALYWKVIKSSEEININDFKIDCLRNVKNGCD